MSLSPENHLNDRSARMAAGSLSTRYVYRPASAACTQQIIDEGPKATSSISFTSARPSPTPSVKNLNLSRCTSPSLGASTASINREAPSSYKQALADAERREADAFRPRLLAREQSWNEQDLKAMQQKMLMLGEKKLQGFSEENRGEHTSVYEGEGR